MYVDEREAIARVPMGRGPHVYEYRAMDVMLLLDDISKTHTVRTSNRCCTSSISTQLMCVFSADCRFPAGV